jgi:nicotinamide-nucleotide amidase
MPEFRNACDARPEVTPGHGDLAQRAGAALRARRLKLATAESCTGGGIAWWLTSVPGSSAWFDRGFVTYSNAAKEAQLGVRAETLARHGAVSEAVVREMVRGALAHSEADIAVAVTGIAGPGGGSPGKPVGTVWLAWQARGGEPESRCLRLSGDRAAVRDGAIVAALEGILRMVG